MFKKIGFIIFSFNYETNNDDSEFYNKSIEFLTIMLNLSEKSLFRISSTVFPDGCKYFYFDLFWFNVYSKVKENKKLTRIK